MMSKNWDEVLHIKTDGRDDVISDEYNYPYEPTPYSVLERLVESGLIRRDDCVIDYGCGKGRVDFYLHHEIGCECIGVEYDRRIYDLAIENKRCYKGGNVGFHLGRAEEYTLPQGCNRFYFFNPFSVEILYTVLNNILISYYEHPREIFLFFYYPSEEYIAHLMTHDGFSFYDEIDCSDLFKCNQHRERIMVFTID